MKKILLITIMLCIPFMSYGQGGYNQETDVESKGQDLDSKWDDVGSSWDRDRKDIDSQWDSKRNDVDSQWDSKRKDIDIKWDDARNNLDGHWNNFLNNHHFKADQVKNNNAFPDGKFALPSPDNYDQTKDNNGNVTKSGVSLRAFILQVLNFLLGFLGIAGVVAVIYAGFLYISSSMDEAQAEQAKKILTWVPVGLILVLVSYALVNTIIGGVTSGCDDRGDCPEEYSSGREEGSNVWGGGKQSITEIIKGETSDIVVSATNSNHKLIKYRGKYMTSFPTACTTNFYPDEASCKAVGCKWNSRTQCDAQTGDVGVTTQLPLNFKLKFNAKGIFDFDDGGQQSFDNSRFKESYTTDDLIDSLNPFSKPIKDSDKFKQDQVTGVNHTFTREGVYNIRSISISNDTGEEFEFNTTLFIGGIQAKIQGTSTLKTGKSVRYRSMATTKLGNIVGYKWECKLAVDSWVNSTTPSTCVGFDDTPNNEKSKIFTPTHTVATNYTIGLTVTNTIGLTASVDKKVALSVGDTQFDVNDGSKKLTPYPYPTAPSNNNKIQVELIR